jgi:hypothetical protein
MHRRALVLLGMAAALSSGNAAVIAESFATDPLPRGWRRTGETNLFRWNAAGGNLDVTWDSARSNSYFHLPLGTIVSQSDDFSLAFDLRVSDIAIGTSPGKPYTFQIAVGLLNLGSATATNFFRGAGHSAFGPRNIVEFSYFPDSGFGATFAPTVASTNNRIAFSDNHPLELTTGDLFRIAIDYSASNQLLKTAVTRNGAPFGLPPGNALEDLDLSAHADFRVDTLAVMSYSDALQVGSTQFWGSVRAHGTVDNILVTLPDPPVTALAGSTSNGTWRVEFVDRAHWHYTLQRTEDFLRWTNVSGPIPGTGAGLVLVDDSGPENRGFYRIQAEKP